MSRRDRNRGAAGKAKAGIRVDFKGVEGRRSLIPDGEYSVAVEEITKSTSEAGNDNIEWKFSVVSEDSKLNNAKLWYNTSLLPQSLWNLRNLLETLGVEVPDGPLDIDFKELVGLEMMAVVEADTYEGKKRSKIVDFYPTEDGEGDGKEKVVAGDEGEIEGMTVEEINELEDEEFAEIIERYDLDINLKAAKTLKKKRALLLETMEKAGFIVEDDGAADSLDKLTVDEVGEMEEKELEDVVERYELDIDLKDLKTRRKKANAIIDALEEKGLLADEN